jgi:hypothetical protein
MRLQRRCASTAFSTPSRPPPSLRAGSAHGWATTFDLSDVAIPAARAWLYVAIVGVGYMVSRGLAKAGSREPYWADESDLPGGDRH